MNETTYGEQLTMDDFFNSFKESASSKYEDVKEQRKADRVYKNRHPYTEDPNATVLVLSINSNRVWSYAA